MVRIIIILGLILGSCVTEKSIPCCTYRDNYKQHWMNKRNGTNIYYGQLKSKWDKRK